MEMILFFAGVGAVSLIVIFTLISKMLLIAHPNEVIILSGRRRKLANGEEIGYRTIRGGRTIKMPLIEKATRMSLETIPIELEVINAYSKGGIPLKVEAIANIKIASTEPSFGNAVERFLTRSASDIHAIAKDTLEGNLRGVLASLTPEEVNEDRLKFAETLMDEADLDLNKLGLQLDTLKITNISDDNDYLNSIGRGKTAEVISRAKKIEAEKMADAQEAEATALERAEKAKANANQEIEKAKAISNQEIEKAKAIANQEIERAKILSEQQILIATATKKAAAEEADAQAHETAEKAKAIALQNIQNAQIDTDKSIKISRANADKTIEIEKNNYRMTKADLEKQAIVKEKEAEVAGQLAKVKYEQELERQRIELQKQKLMADVIEPAKAKKEALELEAKGEAASIIADGEAHIEVLRKKIDAYLSAQGNGDKVFMLNMLPEIISQLTNVVKDVKIDKMTVIDSGNNNDSSPLNKVISQLPNSVISLNEVIEKATGVDILSNFKKTNDDSSK